MKEERGHVIKLAIGAVTCNAASMWHRWVHSWDWLYIGEKLVSIPHINNQYGFMTGLNDLSQY